MSRKAAPVVSEMLKAIEGIEEALAGKTFEDSRANGFLTMESSAA
jgi:hypothetical protein